MTRCSPGAGQLRRDQPISDHSGFGSSGLRTCGRDVRGGRPPQSTLGKRRCALIVEGACPAMPPPRHTMVTPPVHMPRAGTAPLPVQAALPIQAPRRDYRAGIPGAGRIGGRSRSMNLHLLALLVSSSAMERILLGGGGSCETRRIQAGKRGPGRGDRGIHESHRSDAGLRGGLHRSRSRTSRAIRIRHGDFRFLQGDRHQAGLRPRLLPTGIRQVRIRRLRWRDRRSGKVAGACRR